MTNSSIDTKASLDEDSPLEPSADDASRAEGGEPRVESATPRKRLPGPSLNYQANTSESRKRDNLEAKRVWHDMLKNKFDIQDVSSFLDAMGPGQPVQIGPIVKKAAYILETVAKKLENAEKEKDMTGPMIKYLNKVVIDFPPATKPSFHDTSNTRFPSVEDGDQQEHHTMPDITGSKPGQISHSGDWVWAQAGTVIELKYKIDIMDDKRRGIRDSQDAHNALTQLAKGARNLLMASGSCFVYVVAVFARTKARIFRFDRSGFSVTESFDFTTEKKHLPTFLWRLYNPQGYSTPLMRGADDTISLPTEPEQERMRKAVSNIQAYKGWGAEDIDGEHLWIRAARYNSHTGELEIVRCFTFGNILSRSDGLFGRATRVFRVILEEDVDAKEQDVNAEEPTVYALKDAWPQECRRPEADFYRLIEEHCKREVKEASGEEREQKQAILDSVAKCHGSLDLSVEHDNSDHDPQLHQTNPTGEGGPNLARHHMRLLLTPVGTPLKDFESTKSLVGALFCAMRHHQTAYNAGVTHRDVSEGNVLFREVPLSGHEFNGFLLDWDYAEFTPAGAERFNDWFPDNPLPAADVDKSLKDITGTFPFMAIEIIKNSDGVARHPVLHGPHHDLESFFWLLVWMVLRHTDLNKDPLACSKLFDRLGHQMKYTYVGETIPIDNTNRPLYALLERYREAVKIQNLPPPSKPDNDAEELFGPAPTSSNTTEAPIPGNLKYEDILGILKAVLVQSKLPWPENDKAQDFVLPSTRKAGRKKDGSLRVSMMKNATGDSSASLSVGTTAVAGGSGSKKRAAAEVGVGEGSQSKKVKTAEGTVKSRGKKK
ncbi:hypothetical protein FB45DRAFT_1005940 [Roridomyces roridus]|uniref:Fungal-type protein kinase domain-containing protein n=1 Tax=Roridomyces roridus TaxID=1738132 RepID=A0AAD7BKH8_9AGAR|nr:hypothetical protein FB45DRAFT_1005940 [Roridomyces roridus]